MPSGTSAPAATIDSSPTTAPFRTIAPMPIRQSRSIVQPCRVTECPTVTSSASVVGCSRRDVEDAVVLDVRPGPDADPVHVAPDDRVHPDAGVVAQLDVADHLGGHVHPGASAQRRTYPLVGADHADLSENRQFSRGTGRLPRAAIVCTWGCSAPRVLAPASTP